MIELAALVCIGLSFSLAWLIAKRKYQPAGTMIDFADIEISQCQFIEMDSYRSTRNGREIIVQPLFCVKCGNISEGWNYAD